MIVLAPSTVQEQYDHVGLGFELAFKYRNPVMILSDGAIGQMMEKVTLTPQLPRENKILDWATTGKTPDRERNYITSLYLDPEVQENHNIKLQAKFQRMKDTEVRYEEIMTDDAEYIIVAYGISARISQTVITMARKNGIKLGLLRPITLFRFHQNDF